MVQTKSNTAAADPLACAPPIVEEHPPPKTDPLWEGHTTGVIKATSCLPPGAQNLSTLPNGWTGEFWAPDAKAAQPKATPEEAAQQAMASLHLPKPGVHRSPNETNDDAGMPFTWVNLWTWYWTTPATWQHLSATASLPGVSATVKAVPEELTFDPGDGSAPVTCAGPGRAWTTADGDAAPTGGACAYAYKHISDSLKATVSIRWAASWTGTGGANGTFPAITTTTTSPAFKVEQIEVVNR